RARSEADVVLIGLQVRHETPGGGQHLDLVPWPDLFGQPGGEQPTGYPPDADAELAAPSRADRVGAALLPPLVLPAQRQRLAGQEVELVGQLLRYCEADRDRVRAQLLDSGDAQFPEGGAAPDRSVFPGGRCSNGSCRHAQISLTCSKGSWQERHRRSALQEVEPKRDTSSVSGEPHCGQGTCRRGGSRASGTGPVGRCGALPGGAIPYSASFRLPSAEIQSVVH